MNITFRQLRLFRALADTGSVSAAARLLHVTQPTASMQLKEITRSVGLPLYEVVGRKVYLSEAGLTLAATAREMMAAWDGFQQAVDGLQGLTRGTLKIAVVSTAKYFLPRLVGSFCERYPKIEVAMEILNRDRVLQRIHDNMDDLYVMSRPPQDMDLVDEVFMANPLVVIAPLGDPLGDLSEIPLTTLATRRFVLREAGSGTRMAVDEHFRAHGFQPEIRLQLGSNEAIREAVAGGLGVGIVSAHALRGGPGEHGVVTLPVNGFPLPSHWHLVYPAAKRPSLIARAFADHLRSAPRP
jgi:hypothetical protein